ncbi:hypothetical protein PENTCL1PPCAC_4592, partial [Pristionchus entomophagus]
RLQETINEVDDDAKEKVAEVCRRALALARWAIVYFFTLSPFNLTITFVLFFPLPYIVVFIITNWLINAVSTWFIEEEVEEQQVPHNVLHVEYTNISFEDEHQGSLIA